MIGRALSGALLTGMTVAWAMPAAAAPGHAFNVPEQDLGAALRMLGRQAGVDILFQPQTVARRRSVAVRGAMPPLNALRLLLRGNPDLEAVMLDEGTWVVRRARIVARHVDHPASITGGADVPAPREDRQDIVVTASRRATLLGGYPGSIAVIRGASLEEGRRSSLADAAGLIPGLNLSETGSGQRRITMRGMHSAGENSVLLYLDDTPISGPSSATSDVSQMSPDLRLYDLDRIEVLRGPQGTLFGSGALGGAVRLITNQPDMTTFSAEATVGGSATQGGGPGFVSRAVFNVPIARDVLALRALVYDEHRGGYVDNTALGIDNVDHGRTTGGRVMLRLEPAPDVDVTLTGLYQRQRIADLDGWFPVLGRGKTDMAERLPFPNDLSLATLTGHARIDGVQFTLSAAHYRWSVTRYIDSTRPALKVIESGTYCPLFVGAASCDDDQLAAYRNYVGGLVPLVGIQPMEVEANTGEIRLATPSGEPLSVTAGLFYEQRADHSRSSTYRVDAATGTVLVPLVSTFQRSIAVETRQLAMFADVGWRFADGLVLAAGARRYYYRKGSTAQVLQTSYVNGAVAGPAETRAAESSGWTGRANLSYQPNPGLLLYAQVATGFRPGGVNSVPNLPSSLVAYRSDSARSYEVGWRGDWFDGRLVASGSGYWIDWRNMQTASRIPSFLFVSNSGAARVVGMDLDLAARPVARLEVQLGVNLLDSRLTRDQSNSVVVAPGLKGDRVPFEPNLKLAGTIEYSLPLRGGTGVKLGAELGYTGVSYSDFRPTSAYYERMGGFADIALHAEYGTPRWRTRLILSNLLDTAGAQRVESSVGSERLTISQRPRTVSLEFSWKFSAPQK